MELSLQDEEGAEIDEQVLPILLDQATTPNLIFLLNGEELVSTTSQVVTIPSTFAGNLIVVKYSPLIHTYLSNNIYINYQVSV